MAVSSLYESMGGRAACRRLAVAFYARVEHDPVLRPLFPGKSFQCTIEEFAAFLAQFLGGPSDDAQRRWWVSLRESHLRFNIGRKERDAWLANMAQALEDVQFQGTWRAKLLRFFEQSSAYVVNDGETGQRSSEHEFPIELADRWEAQRKLDEAVALIRSGDADDAIRLAESSALEALGGSAQFGLLVLMVRCRHGKMLDYVRTKLAQSPELGQERHAGRTLLHEAAGAGDLTTVTLLLEMGVDPNVKDGGQHTPLYSVANECKLPGGDVVVRTLVVKAGADVNAHEGAKRCTALHMAARRGNIEVAEALLDCGAALEARDSAGDTPLRRAVNCNQTELAALLVTRGADLNSQGSRGITPVMAARTVAMRQVLHKAVGSPRPLDI